MPEGHILDPRLNIQEDTQETVSAKNYGFLTNAANGHTYMYLKDKNSQFYTHGTPLKFTDEENLVEFKLVDDKNKDVAIIEVYVGIEADNLSSYPVVERMNDLASANGTAAQLETKAKEVRKKIKVK